MKTRFRIGVSEETIPLIQQIELEGGSLSEPHPSSSDAEGLNAPFGGAEIIIGLKIIAATFAAGTAALKFLKELRGSLRAGEKAVVESEDGSKRMMIDSNTPEAELEDFLG